MARRSDVSQTDPPSVGRIKLMEQLVDHAATRRRQSSGPEEVYELVQTYLGMEILDRGLCVFA